MFPLLGRQDVNVNNQSDREGRELGWCQLWEAVESSGPRSSYGDYMYEVRKERKYRRVVPGLVSPRDCRLVLPQEARDELQRETRGSAVTLLRPKDPLSNVLGRLVDKGPGTGLRLLFSM